MLPDLESYFSAINASESVQSRVDEILVAFSALLPEGQTCERLFIADAWTQEEGLRMWTGLWGFTKKYWLNAQDFMTRFDVDVSGYENSIKYLSIQFEAMNFADTKTFGVSSDSRLNVEVETGDDLGSEISATGENCRFLADIVLSVLRKNLRSQVI